MWFEPKRGQTRGNAEQKLEVVKNAERHGNAAAAKHNDTDESNIRYWRKQKLVLATMPAKKRLSYSGLCELILKVWTEISADTIMNVFVKASITEKTITIEITAENESVTEDIASDTETLPDELMDMIDEIGFSSESQFDLLDN